MQDENAATPADEPTYPAFDRRRGPRRGVVSESEIPVERRQSDRRKRKPGLAGLFGAIFGTNDKDDSPEG